MTMNLALVFPGQGSQYVGMGTDMRAETPLLDRILHRAEELTGQDVATAMFTGPKERLTDTVAAQLSVFALSIALADLLARRGLRPAAVAGHSLGEYSALVAGGWLDLDDALTAVARRAAAMRDCCAETEGTMTAVLGLPPQVVADVVAGVGGDAVIANANSPRQTVVSGTKEAVREAGFTALQRGARAIVPLDVDGAFHSPLMAVAERRLGPVIAELPLRRGDVPLISSVNGDLVTDPEAYRALLTRQITSTVDWTGVMNRLTALPVEGCIEVGPGKVLRGLFRHVDRRAPITCCGSYADVRSLTDVVVPLAA